MRLWKPGRYASGSVGGRVCKQRCRREFLGRERERERETRARQTKQKERKRQRDRESERQRDRGTEGQRDRETQRETERESGSQSEKGSADSESSKTEMAANQQLLIVLSRKRSRGKSELINVLFPLCS